MKLFGVILKLIQVLGLTTSEELTQLHTDVKDWELGATENSEDKLKLLYYKLHKGVFFRLLAPFLYFLALREVRNLMAPDEERTFD